MRKLLFLMVLTGLLALSSLGPGSTAHAADDVCLATQLKAARVSVSVSLKHDGEATTRAESRLVVRVPKTWGLAPDLLLNGDSERYRKAMRCLLRDPAASQTQRDTEWRPGPPAVVVTEKWITVDYFAVTHVDDRRDRDFGVWRISWRAVLEADPAPPALLGPGVVAEGHDRSRRTRRAQHDPDADHGLDHASDVGPAEGRWSRRRCAGGDPAAGHQGPGRAVG